MSFSAGPPRYLVCRDERPLLAAATFESAVKFARELAVDRSENPVMIYEIATSPVFDVTDRPSAPALKK